MGFICCVPECKSKNAEKTMYSFPNEQESVQKWLEKIGRMDLLYKDLKILRKNYRVCELHFSDQHKFESVRNRSNLKKNAIPDSCLPEEQFAKPAAPAPTEVALKHRSANRLNLINKPAVKSEPPPAVPAAKFNSPQSVPAVKSEPPPAAPAVRCDSPSAVPAAKFNSPQSVPGVKFAPSPAVSAVKCGPPPAVPAVKLNPPPVVQEVLNDDLVTQIHDELDIKIEEIVEQKEECFSCNKENDVLPFEKTYYSFPLDKKIREGWLSFCGLTKENTRSNLKLCSLHFSEDSYKTVNDMATLKDDAIPTVTAVQVKEQYDRVRRIYDNFHKICRICLGTSNLRQVQELDTHLGYLTKKKVNHVNRPQQVCVPCLKELNSVNMFVEKIESSTDWLNEIIELVELKNRQPQQSEENHANRDLHIEQRQHPADNDTNRDLHIEHEVMKYEDPGQDFLCEDSIGASEEIVPAADKEEPDRIVLEQTMDAVDRDIKDLSNKLETMLKTSRRERKARSRRIFLICKKEEFRQGKIEPVQRITQANTKCRDCPKCGRSFPFKSFLRQHMIRQHKTTDDLNQNLCHICGKTVVFLGQHLNTHLQDKNFICQYCGVRTTSSITLSRHIRKEHKEPRYRCDVCRKSFEKGSLLRRHLQTHDPQIRHICDICGKMYTTDIGLKDHLNVHTGQRPFRCKICGAGFAIRSTYFHHVKWHKNGEQGPPSMAYGRKKRITPNKTFGSSTIAHQELFECGICKRTFKFKSICVKHVARHATANKLTKIFPEAAQDNSSLEMSEET